MSLTRRLGQLYFSRAELKNTYYFPHDFNATNDPKLLKLAMTGWDLVGLYWAIIEMLHEQGGYLETNPEPIAFALRTNKERIATLINFPNLFVIKNGKFTTNRVLNNLEFLKAKTEKARESAYKRWNNAKAMPTHSERNAKAMLESKVKESKVKEKIIPRIFDFESIWLLYPKKLGKEKAEIKFHKTVKTDEKYQNIKAAITNFNNSSIAKGEPKYIPYGSTWFNNWQDWIDYKEPITEKDKWVTP